MKNPAASSAMRPCRPGSATRAAGVEHDVINDNDGEFVFIEIEMK